MTNTTPAIQLTGLTKRYGSLTAVDAVDLTVPAGQILALLGPNGAGKSTTTEMVLGLVKPDAGAARGFGATPTDAMRAGTIGAMLQNGTLLWDTPVRSLLAMMHGLHTRPLALDEVIERADLSDILRTSTSKLSGGQAQRVRFALAIMADPRLLFLDEPTVGMDVDARRRFWRTMGDLTSDGRTIVFATHYLDEADEFADRIVVLNHGRVVADGAGRVRALFTGPDAHAVRDLEVTSPSLEDAFLTPDVVLLDVQMPDGGLAVEDGIDAIPALLAGAPGAKVVVVTTFGRPGYLRRALEAGAIGFMVKDSPVDRRWGVHARHRGVGAPVGGDRPQLPQLRHRQARRPQPRRGPARGDRQRLGLTPRRGPRFSTPRAPAQHAEGPSSARRGPRFSPAARGCASAGRRRG